MSASEAARPNSAAGDPASPARPHSAAGDPASPARPHSAASDPASPARPNSAALDELSSLLGERLLREAGRRLASYRRDMVSTTRLHREPLAVTLPETTAEVGAIMQLASRYGLSVTTRGGGSGLAGGAIASEGGIVLSTERMRGVRKLDPDNLVAVVEAGVVTRELDAELARHGLFFAGYPMSEEICTIGGNVATNAGGGRAVKYGVTADHVLGLEVVTATGAVLELGGPRIKDVAGLNLLPLFIGSEGILGVITAVTLRLTPRPVSRLALLLAFPDSATATAAVSSLRRAVIGVPSSIEYIDGSTARGAAGRLWRAGAAPFELGNEHGALLLVEAEGRSEEQCLADLDHYTELAADCGGSTLIRADGPELLTQVWKLRKAVPWWVKRSSGEYHSVEDVVVPGTVIPELVAYAEQLRTRHGLELAIFGHAGDGNFHINPMKPAAMEPENWDHCLHDFLDDLYRFAVDHGGSISGEHGIGRKRVAALSRVTDPQVMSAMQAVRHALDPQGILNPGVLLP